MPDDKRNELPSHHHLRPDARKPQDKGISGLTVLKVAGVALVGLFGGVKVIQYIENAQREGEVDAFRRQLPIPGEYEVPQEFLREGWEASYQVPDFSGFDLQGTMNLADNATKEALADLEVRMSASSYPPFSDTIAYIGSFYQQDIPGEIQLAIDFFPKKEVGGDTVFGTAMYLDINGQLEAKIAANAALFTPGAQADTKKLLTRDVWAIGFAHEKAHHELGLSMFSFWTGRGLSPEEALKQVVKDPYQEPYAYAHQAQITLPLLDLGFSDRLPPSFTEVAQQWDAHRKKGGTWYDDGWVRFINAGLGRSATYSPNIPLAQASTDHASKILASPAVTKFIA